MREPEGAAAARTAAAMDTILRMARWHSVPYRLGLFLASAAERVGHRVVALVTGVLELHVVVVAVVGEGRIPDFPEQCVGKDGL